MERIASRPQTVATADELGEVWKGLRRGHAFPLTRLIGRHLEHEQLEDLAIPLHVVAVDVLTGEELRLSAGPLREAILASAAIPGGLEPMTWGQHALIDGGVVNNTPISHAIELGATRIYVLPTGHACALEKPPGGALAMALHAISLLTQPIRMRVHRNGDAPIGRNALTSARRFSRMPKAFD